MKVWPCRAASAGAQQAAPSQPASFVAGLDARRLETARTEVQEFSALAAAVEPAPQHAFREARCAEWSAGTEEALRAALGRALAALQGWDEARRQLAAEAGLGDIGDARAEDLALAARKTALSCGVGPDASPEWPERARRLKEAISLRRATEGRRAELDARWQADFFKADCAPLLQRFERWTGAFFIFAWIMLWGARRRLRPLARVSWARTRRCSRTCAQPPSSKTGRSG